MGQHPRGRALSRRTLLAGFGASAAGLAVAPAAGHPTPQAGDGGGTRGESTPEATPPSYAPLGHVHVEGTKEAVVDRIGETAFLATTSGFATVDVSDPRAPRVLADRRDLLDEMEGGPLVEIHDVDYRDGRLLVVGPANPVEGALRAAVLYDVRDPAAPERIAVYETAYPIHNAALGDGVAYLTGNDFERNALVIADVEGEAELGRWSVVDADPDWRRVDPTLWVVHDVTVREDFAFVANWDAGTWIVDVSEPTAPEAVVQVRGRDPATLASLDRDAVGRERHELPGNDHYAAANDDGTLLGVGLEAWDRPDTDVDGGPGGIELWDVSRPSAPERVSTIESPPTSDPGFGGVWTTAHNFSFHGDRLYTSWYRGGVRLYDVSDPRAPAVVRAWRDENLTSFWAARVAVPGSYFVASTRENFGAPGAGEDPVTGGLYAFPDPPAEPTGTSTEQPGFGTAVGLAGLGLGLGAWRALRSAEE